MPLAPGDSLGPYELQEEIGRGGMGIIFRARDTRLQRTVAIKIISGEYLAGEPAAASAGGSMHRGRFLREARAVAALNHPNICTIYDMGEAGPELGEAAGQPYLVMELLEGETLRHALQRGPLPVDDVLRFLLEASSALAAAHAKGIIHRDIKPANLFLVRGVHGQRHLKILDFGLARRGADMLSAEDGAFFNAATAISTSGELTSPGSTIGTVGYMSPEQARGEPLDVRTDLFSLGTVLFAMATGRQAFAGGSQADIFVSLLTQQPPALSSLRPELPPGLDAICDRLLRKARSERYQSAADLHADVESLMQLPATQVPRTTSAVLADPSTAAKVRSAPAGDPRRHRKTIYVGLVAAAAVIAVTTSWLVFRHSPAMRDSLAVAGTSSGTTEALSGRDSIIIADFKNTTGDDKFDPVLRTGFAMQMEQSPFLNILGEEHLRQSLAYMGKPADTPIDVATAREIAQREGVKAVLTGTISRLGTQYALELRAINTSTGDTFATAQDSAARAEDVLTALGKAATEMRKYLGESMSSIQKLDTPLTQATTRSLDAFRAFALGEQAHARGEDIPDAVGFYKRAAELDPNFAMAWARLGVAYGNVGATTKQALYVGKAFALSQNVSERERFYIASRYYSDVQGDSEKAIQTLQIYAQTYPRDAIAANNLAVEYIGLGRLQDSLTWAQKAAALAPQRAAVYLNIMNAQIVLDRPADAVQTFAKNKGQLTGQDVNLQATYAVAAWLNGDTGPLKGYLAEASTNVDAYQYTLASAVLHDSAGQIAAGGTDWAAAAAAASQQNLNDVAGLLLAIQAADQALTGQCSDVRPNTRASIAKDQQKATTFNDALALALCGDTASTANLIAHLKQIGPDDTLVQHVFLPSIAAAQALAAGDGQAVLNAYAGQQAYDLVSIAPYLRGLALLKLDQPARALAEFQKVRNHRGVYIAGPFIQENVATTPAYSLAELGVARAISAMGNKAAAAKAYKTFLDEWKDADADLAPVTAAKQEMAALQGAS